MPTDVTDLLAEIRKLDWGARLLIDTQLRAAAAHVADTTQPWIELATAAQLRSGPDIELIIHLTQVDVPTGIEAKRRALVTPLRDKHAALVLLGEQANALAKAYAREIAAIEVED